MSQTPPLQLRVRSAGRRVRAMRALNAATWAVAGSLACAVLMRFVVGQAEGTELGVAVACTVLVTLLAALAGAARRVDPLPLLHALDRHHGLADLLASAWSFTRAGPGRDGALVRTTLARAQRAAEAVDVRGALPFRRPPGTFPLVLAIVAACVAWSAHATQPSAATPAAAAVAAPAKEALLSPAALAEFRARLARLEVPDSSSSAAGALRAELERILDQLARAPANRLQVLRQLGALEARTRVLAAKTSAERAAAERAAAAWMPPSVATTHESGAPSAAGEPPSVASAPPQSATPPAAPKAPTARVPEEPPAPAAEQRENDPQATELGAVGRPNAPPAGDRNQRGQTPPASSAAQPMAAAPSGPGSEGAPRGPDVERQRPQFDREREHAENLGDAISELRDLMRRDEPVQADIGEASPAPPGADRSRDPKQEGKRGDRTGAPDAAYASGGPQPDPAQRGGNTTAADPQLPAAGVRVQGPQNAGPVRSQVIYAAAQPGLVGGDYARVHAEYEAHAERELSRENVPPGYRSYVRRYFQAIAPNAQRSPEP